MILFDFYILHFELFSRQNLCNNLSFRVYLSFSIDGQIRGLLPARIGESRVYTGMASPRSGFSDAWSECSSHWMLSCTTDIWWPNAFFFLLRYKITCKVCLRCVFSYGLLRNLTERTSDYKLCSGKAFLRCECGNGPSNLPLDWRTCYTDDTYQRRGQ